MPNTPMHPCTACWCYPHCFTCFFFIILSTARPTPPAPARISLSAQRPYVLLTFASLDRLVAVRPLAPPAGTLARSVLGRFPMDSHALGRHNKAKTAKQESSGGETSLCLLSLTLSLSLVLSLSQALPVPVPVCWGTCPILAVRILRGLGSGTHCGSILRAPCRLKPNLHWAAPGQREGEGGQAPGGHLAHGAQRGCGRLLHPATRSQESGHTPRSSLSLGFTEARVMSHKVCLFSSLWGATEQGAVLLAGALVRPGSAICGPGATSSVPIGSAAAVRRHLT